MYTQNTIFDIKKKIILNYPKFAAIGFCSKRLNNEFETAVVNEPSVFEPHRGDSNVYTQNTIFDIKKKIILNYPKFAAIGFCSKRLNNEFETAVVNEPSVFEPRKFYCSYVYVGSVSLIHRAIFLSLAYVWFILFYNE